MRKDIPDDGMCVKERERERETERERERERENETLGTIDID